MSRCEYCGRPCRATTVYCDECRVLLQNQYQTVKLVEVGQEGEERASVAPQVLAMSSYRKDGESEESWEAGGSGRGGNIFERITSPVPVVRTQEVETPLAPVQEQVQETYSLVEQALNRLNEAARRIAKAEGGQRRHPHASRLTPLRDISAEIQRESTPLPNVAPEKEINQGTGNDRQSGRRMPDLWPWLQEGDAEEGENDSWANRTDPLQARRFPNSSEVARIEEEDMRRAVADGWMTRPLPANRRSRLKRMQSVFIVLVTLAVLALLVDGVLASLAFFHTNREHPAPAGPPSITFASNEVYSDGTVATRIRNFSPNTQVYLTHDTQEAIETRLANGSSGNGLVKVDANGNANVSLIVDESWGAGFHTVYAEDVTTRYTASSTLQILGAGTTIPSQLVIGPSSLDFGSDYQGANTIKTLTLHNAGDGSISWAASSNQPWLLISPAQGTFSASQTIEVAVERSGLKPGDYSGKITFTANVGLSVSPIAVYMSVKALPANAGPVLVVTPAVLSFTALDGQTPPPVQELVINNPGSQPLSWSLENNATTPTTFVGEQLLLHLFGDQNWLQTSPSSGIVQPGQTESVYIFVNSRILLPGVYTSNLVFNGGSEALNSPQIIGVSLTVQPNCGLILSTGSISFTAVAGQSNPSNQALSLSATSSCTTSLPWQAQSSASWLTITPASGQLKASQSAVTSIGVNTSGLKAATYQGTVSFLTGNSQTYTNGQEFTLAVTLVVQQPPQPTSPIMGATPLNLNYSATQGSANPAGQVVTITNNGRSPLYWHVNAIPLAWSWLGAAPSGGTVAPGQTGQVTVNVDTSNLTPGTYVGQVVISGTDASGKTASGSPQTIAVNLLVLPPCALAQPSLSALTFNGVVGGTAPAAQALTITATGNCGWPLNWNATVSPHSATWLTVSPSSGLIAASGQSASMSAAVNLKGMKAGTYTANISITAIDSASATAQGSPQVIPVTLVVQPPCSLQVSPANLSFTGQLGQGPPGAQTLAVSGTGGCNYPVSWTASADSGSRLWLSLSPTSGSDNGTGSSLAVNIKPAKLTAGTYNGTITISAQDGGTTIQGSPQTVTVTLTVTGAIGGAVMACVGGICTNAVALPGATVNLLNSSGVQVASVTADASGNYSFSTIAAGSYTLSVSGTLNGVSYSGTQAVTLSTNQTGIVVDAMPG